MISRIFFWLIAACIPAASQAQIITTSHVTDIVPLIDQDTWLLVDLDNTMYEGKQALGHAAWFYDQVLMRILNGMSQDEAIQDAYPYWIKTQNVCPVKPLEDNFVPILLGFQQQGIVVMGLTQRQPSVAEATIKQVSSLGFDFGLTAPIADGFEVPAKKPLIYIKGILMVGDYNKKSDIFLPFLVATGQIPKKVVFIDDRKDNVVDMDRAMQQQGIDYIGVHYTALDNVPRVYYRDLAEFQAKFLDKIMSNEAARLLMENGLE